MSEEDRVPAINTKQELRRHFRQLRRQQLSLFPAIHAAVEVVLKDQHRQQSSDRIIGIYWPLADEVDLRGLRQRSSVALPVADGQGGLVYRRWAADGATSQILKPDGCGIPAPAAGRTLQPQELACLLVPALAIDRRGVRLGYGGGYYDRLRQQAPWRAVPALVVLPSACITDTPLPQDPWDITFDGWISEKGPGRPLATAAS
jgi:5-formyltetrahydrofolate cyclo-ligase|tara:strand:- start:424 stop:1032 length:609 start_codon:yes stop_codon:yes gene_type:complete